ncbi:MAG: hypothetical protein FD180_4747 [Planctomycetota bacterium]|nr:MAG: hypothetical protein FD180_4747 [Planctomycetota bacterium]
MAAGLEREHLPFEVEVPIPLHYLGCDIGDFRADIVVAKTVILELKALKEVDADHEAQLISYLRVARMPVGLLMNFGPKKVVVVRKVWSPWKGLGEERAG